jgi:hypothetical protein
METKISTNAQTPLSEYSKKKVEKGSEKKNTHVPAYLVRGR